MRERRRRWLRRLASGPFDLSSAFLLFLTFNHQHRDKLSLPMSSRAKPAAAPARPAGRYFKGKAPKEAAESDSDDEEEEDDQDQEVKEEDASGADFLASTAGPSRGGQGRGMNVALGKMGVTKEGKVTGGKVEGQSSSLSSPSLPFDPSSPFSPFWFDRNRELIRRGDRIGRRGR